MNNYLWLFPIIFFHNIEGNFLYFLIFFEREIARFTRVQVIYIIFSSSWVRGNRKNKKVSLLTRYFSFGNRPRGRCNGGDRCRIPASGRPVSRERSPSGVTTTHHLLVLECIRRRITSLLISTSL